MTTIVLVVALAVAMTAVERKGLPRTLTLSLVSAMTKGRKSLPTSIFLTSLKCEGLGRGGIGPSMVGAGEVRKGVAVILLPSTLHQ